VPLPIVPTVVASPVEWLWCWCWLLDGNYDGPIWLIFTGPPPVDQSCDDWCSYWLSVRIPDIAGILQKMSNKNLLCPFFDSCRVFFAALQDFCWLWCWHWCHDDVSVQDASDVRLRVILIYFALPASWRTPFSTWNDDSLLMVLKEGIKYKQLFCICFCRVCHLQLHPEILHWCNGLGCATVVVCWCLALSLNPDYNRSWEERVYCSVNCNGTDWLKHLLLQSRSQWNILHCLWNNFLTFVAQVCLKLSLLLHSQELDWQFSTLTGVCV